MTKPFKHGPLPPPKPEQCPWYHDADQLASRERTTHSIWQRGPTTLAAPARMPPLSSSESSVAVLSPKLPRKVGSPSTQLRRYSRRAASTPLDSSPPDSGSDSPPTSSPDVRPSGSKKS